MTRQPLFESAFQSAPELTPETTKATKAIVKVKISPLKLRKIFLNQIKNKENNINELIFREYFDYQSPLFLVNDLYEDNQNKSHIIIHYIN